MRFIWMEKFVGELSSSASTVTAIYVGTRNLHIIKRELTHVYFFFFNLH